MFDADIAEEKEQLHTTYPKLEERATDTKRRIVGLAGSGADIRGKVASLGSRAGDDEQYAENLFKDLRGVAQKAVSDVQDSVILPAFNLLKYAQRK